MPYIGTCFRFYTQMRVQKKAFAYRIYSHFTQCRVQLNLTSFYAKKGKKSPKNNKNKPERDFDQ